MCNAVFNEVRNACEAKSAIRWRVSLQPMGGAQDKVFPPTYLGEQDKPSYALEERMTAEGPRRVVLLDSVQSQANRLEECLLEASRQGEGGLGLPMFQVHIPDRGWITSLETPHRCFDAILRDCLVEGVPFRQSAPGRALIATRRDRAAEMFALCPTGLLFGCWDSTSIEKTSGLRLERALVSEIVAWDGLVGQKTSSRLDPLHITDLPIYETPEGGWTADPGKARQDKKGKPVLHPKKKSTGINHSNIPPSLTMGGVSISRAEQVAVLSLIQLRRLRFPDAAGGASEARDLAARTVLACLGLYALAAQLERGYDLRSRCVLIPESRPPFEILGMTLEDRQEVQWSAEALLKALRTAVEAAREQGLGWSEPFTLTPSDALLDLVSRSRLTAENEDTTEEAAHAGN